MIELHNVDILDYLQGETQAFDLVLADPPYSSGGMLRGDRMASTKTKYIRSDSANQDTLLNFLGDTRDQRSYLTWCWMWMSACMDKMNDGAVIGVFTDWRQLPTTTDALQAAGFVWRGIVPWHKQASRPQADRYTASCEYLVWGTKGARESSPAPESRYPEGWYSYKAPKDRVHVTEKPIELYRHLLQIARNGATVLDPFLGSAASAIAANLENRNLHFVGLEKSKPIYDMAVQRITDHQAQPRLFDASPTEQPVQLQMVQ
jgi:site-specific DNA-methyltransferase (adenine-specific)